MKKLTDSPSFKPLCVIFMSLIFLPLAFFAQVVSLAGRFAFYDAPGVDEAVDELLRERLITDLAAHHIRLTHRGFFDFVFSFRSASVVFLAILSAVFLLALALLLSRAGVARGSDDTSLNHFDRMPPDLALALWAAGAWLISSNMSRRWARLSSSLISLPVTIMKQTAWALVLMLITLWLLYTGAARLRSGPIWRGALTLRLWRLCSNGLELLLGHLSRVAAGARLDRLMALIASAFLALQLGGALLTALVSVPAGVAILAVSDAALCSFLLIGAGQLRELISDGEKLASGEDPRRRDYSGMYPHLRRHGEDLSSIGDGLSRAVDQRLRAERMRTELIANVSHDIRAPLTSIINYSDLLQKPHTEEEARQYLDVISRKSEKLKVLITDLVDAAKASSGAVDVDLAPTDLTELIGQAMAEYSAALSDAGLTPVVTMPEERLTVLADGKHLWRILDNLLCNAVKYAQPGTRLYVEAESTGTRAIIYVKNTSRDKLNISGEELMERFVRGDRSRSSDGSGLGLSIAGSLAELMGGRLYVTVDGDLFKARVELKLA